MLWVNLLAVIRPDYRIQEGVYFATVIRLEDSTFTSYNTHTVWKV